MSSRERKPAQKGAKQSAKFKGFTAEERAAMRDRVQELKGNGDGESAVLAKIAARYATLGFSDKAHFDAGHMWPTAFALKQLTAAEDARIGALVKQAVSA